MILHRLSLPALSIATLLIGCSSAPSVIDSTHPASIDAPEATSKPIPRSLGPDAATRRTQTLLAERERQAKAAESATPEDQSDLAQKASLITPPPPDSAPPAEENSKSNPHHE